jgi:hypothetical protein
VVSLVLAMCRHDLAAIETNHRVSRWVNVETRDHCEIGRHVR